MSADTERIPTAHGEIEYETVECAACETKVLVSEAVPVIAGADIRSERRSINQAKIDWPAYTTNLCEYCAEANLGYKDGGVGAIKRELLTMEPAWLVPFIVILGVVGMIFALVIVEVIAAMGGVIWV